MKNLHPFYGIKCRYTLHQTHENITKTGSMRLNKNSTKRSNIGLSIFVWGIWLLVCITFIGIAAAIFLVPGILPASQSSVPTTAAATPTVSPTITPSPAPTETPLPPTQTATPEPEPIAIDLLNAGRLEESITLGKGVFGQVIFSPDGKQIAVSSSTGVRIYDAISLEELGQLATDDWIPSLAYSPDGKVIAAWYPDGSVGLWNVKTMQLVQTLNAGGEGAIRFIADGLSNVTFSSDGKILASGRGDGSIHFWDAATGELLRSIKGTDNSIESIAFSPDGTMLASSAKNRFR